MSLNARRYIKKGQARRRKELLRRWVRATCPRCGGRVVFPGITQKSKANGSADCHRCNALLLVTRGKARLFHQALHESTGGVWPADGRGTAYVEIKA